jgi:hypothetical protein
VSATQARPAGRYGPAPSRRRRLLGGALVAVVVAGALAWFAWAAVRGTPKASAVTVGYRVVDNRTVQITFDVTKPEKSTATCTVEALDTGFGVVGTAQVATGAADTGVVRRVATIRTTNEATTAQVTTCTVALP